METATVRQRLMEILGQGGEVTAIDLSQAVGIGEKEVYQHLPHIARSLATQGRGLRIDPSRCLKCGYVFEDRKRFTRPGRCPRCRATYIRRPFFSIR
ncbi:MAG TPA: transcriptional regulator [Deltaproteobacteria bacterium]|nr:transcriptional regulator [Deltaproteobacteria bacterium]